MAVDVTLTGSGNWTVPGGQAVGTARIITVECFGGGGAGGAGTSASGGGGGGGGGAYSKKTAIAVTPGQVIPYVCGAGGIKNNTGTGGAGQDTTFNTNVCVADGGLGGEAYASMAGGAGGAEANCIGDASSQAKGGNGGLANITYGGGGGESGNFASPNYVDGNAGSAGSAGGAGGTGTTGYDGGAGAAAHGQGSDAPSYAGGGGGGGHMSGGAEYGGTGGPGVILITYTTLESAPTVTLGTPNDGDTITDTTPALLFTGTDANADEVEYEVQVSNDVSFWYNSSWLYRVKITVLASKVAENLSNYPVYVDLSNLPSEFHTNVNQTDGRDIRITSSDGVTELPREVVYYDSANDKGELHFKATSLSHSTDTDFYIYYGNSSATEPSDSSTYG